MQNYNLSHVLENDSMLELLYSFLNPIAYGGGFLSHTTIVLAATLKPLKLWLPNFVTSCFYLSATIQERILAKSICQEGCYSHFSNERS